MDQDPAQGTRCRYIFWNNKGGVGKTTLCFHASTQYAKDNADKNILVVDMCPQKNISLSLLTHSEFDPLEEFEDEDEADRPTKAELHSFSKQPKRKKQRSNTRKTRSSSSPPLEEFEDEDDADQPTRAELSSFSKQPKRKKQRSSTRKTRSFSDPPLFDPTRMKSQAGREDAAANCLAREDPPKQ